MTVIQDIDEIQAVLDRLQGEEIATLQVLGINSLKSTTPLPEALVGDTVESTSVENRVVAITTTRYAIVFDLQRTGKLVWLDGVQPYLMVAGSLRPTARLLLASGRGLDLTEPARTKRITVTLTTRV
ncbi:hypothetical protein EEZ25_18270 [Micromonospora aurantiaca]|uniref:hypothetical protein n=1 Tax=Micromonospora aurantiaca (nom. illeg.) TaxID=47850 RepID=UPI000F3F0432|nr:hypothetical protein [Micromonospora aurantiaca]RNI00956.1 hypothetical protein EEZ25_18270 [Micromonospora aurantiaca]